MERVRTFLMFTGEAEKALAFYQKVFPEAGVGEVKRFGPEAEAMAGKIMGVEFRLGDQVFILNDSPPVHNFTFTPSVSIFVDFSSEARFDEKIAALSQEGSFLMPTDNYGFSRKFAWLQDKFGVSWQLNLPE